MTHRRRRGGFRDAFGIAVLLFLVPLGIVEGASVLTGVRRIWVTERTGDDRRRASRGRWLFLLFAPFGVWFIFWGVHAVWWSVSGPTVPVEIVECHPSGKNLDCTGVWRPTGEAEKTVKIRGSIAAVRGDTVDLRIHGDEAWARSMQDPAIGSIILGVGVFFLGIMLFRAE